MPTRVSRPPRRHRHAAMPVLLAALLLATDALAEDPLTVQWTGLGTTDRFRNTANWVGYVPSLVPGQLAIFSGGSARGHATIDNPYAFAGLLFADGPSGETKPYVLEADIDKVEDGILHRGQLEIGAAGIQNHSSSTVTIDSQIFSTDSQGGDGYGDLLLAAVNGNLDINTGPRHLSLVHVNRVIIEGDPRVRVRLDSSRDDGLFVLTNSGIQGRDPEDNLNFIEIRSGRLLSESNVIDNTDVLIRNGILDLNQRNHTFYSVGGAGGEVWIGRGTLTVDAIFQGSTYHGQLTGLAAGQFVKTGAREITLDGDNSGYLGSFHIVEGGIHTGKRDNISNESTVTIDAGARLAVEGDAEALGGLAGAGKVDLGADLDIGLDDRDHVFDGTINGNGKLTKAGRGRFDLNGQANFIGALRVAAGTLGLGAGHVLAHHHVVTVDKDATLAIAVDDEEIGELAGSGRVQLANTALSLGHDGGDAVFSGNVRGQGEVTKVGVGTWQLSGSSDAWQGRLRVAGGSVLLRRGDTLGDGVSLQVDSGATVEVLDDDERVAGLAGAGDVVLDRRLDVGIDGVDREFSGRTRGAGGLTKSGAGRLVLGGENAYTGETVVNGGSLRVTGKLGGANARIDGAGAEVQVAGPGATWRIDRSLLLGAGSGGTLRIEQGGRVEVGDTLTISERGHLALAGGTLDVQRLQNFRGGVFDMSGGRLQVSSFQGTLRNLGGTLAPGHSPGVASVAGDYQQGADGTLEIELAALDSFDTLMVTGVARLGGRLSIRLLDDYAPEIGNQFVFLNATAGIIGTFDVLDLPVLHGRRFSLVNVDATHLALAVSAVPVPRAVFLCLPALGALMLAARRRERPLLQA